MRAIGYQASLPISDPASLQDIELPRPEPTGHDLLVRVEAVSVNPVDTKVRKRAQPRARPVEGAGLGCRGHGRGDGLRVTCSARATSVLRRVRSAAGHQRRVPSGRRADRRPQARLASVAEAAALPLTAITAWEALFDRLDVRKPVPGAANAILIIGGAGGVGSIATQLARQLTDLTVITTASRPRRRPGAANSARTTSSTTPPLAGEIAKLGLGQPAFVFSTTNTDAHLGEIAELIAPQGRFALIDDPPVIDVCRSSARAFRSTGVHVHAFDVDTADIAEQGRLLNEVARLVDAGTLKTTFAASFGTISAANLRLPMLIESGRSKGKVVLEGWV